MKDFLGNPIAVDDLIIFSPKNYKYTLAVGKIIKITQQRIRAEYRTHFGKEEYVLRPTQVIKHP